MEKVITNDTRAKIAQMYIGQQMETLIQEDPDNPFIVKLTGCKGNILHSEKDSEKFWCDLDEQDGYPYPLLVLTSLSDIIDEDALHIANCDVVHYRDNIIGKWNGKDQSDLINKIKSFIDYYIEYSYVYQYLQSKGYALPYMDYTVDNLVDLGVYKLKSDKK